MKNRTIFDVLPKTKFLYLSGKFTIEFDLACYTDEQKMTIGVNLYGPKAVSKNGTTVFVTLNRKNKGIILGIITSDWYWHKKSIDREIVWDVDPNKSYIFEGATIKGANRITIKKDLSITLDEGQVSIDVDKAKGNYQK